MHAGSGGRHEHIHCSLGRVDSTRVPRQILEDGEGDNGWDGTTLGNISRRSHTSPIAVVSAKYYFNGDARVVFRYRLYSFHAYQVIAPRPVRPVSERGGLGWSCHLCF